MSDPPYGLVVSVPPGTQVMEYAGTGRGFLFYLPAGTIFNGEGPLAAGFYCYGYPDIEYTWRLIACTGTTAGACP